MTCAFQMPWRIERLAKARTPSARQSRYDHQTTLDRHQRPSLLQSYLLTLLHDGRQTHERTGFLSREAEDGPWRGPWGALQWRAGARCGTRCDRTGQSTQFLPPLAHCPLPFTSPGPKALSSLQGHFCFRCNTDHLPWSKKTGTRAREAAANVQKRATLS